MKKLYFALSILQVIFISSCENENVIENSCLQVKIIDQICGNAILQVISGSIDGEIANTWTDGNGNTFHNVFTTMLFPCDTNHPENGDSFFIKIVDEQPTSSSCIRCQAMLSNTPDKYLNIVILSECGASQGGTL